MSVLIGYLRVSKADGSQIPDPQRDTLAVAGVSPEHLDEDHDSGRKTDRPGSAACLAAPISITSAHPGSACRLPMIPSAFHF